MRVSLLATSIALAFALPTAVSAQSGAPLAFFWELQFRSTTTGSASVTLYDDQGGPLCSNPQADCREGFGTSSPGTPVVESGFPFTSSSPFNVGTDYEGSAGETIHLQIGNLWSFTSFITAKVRLGASTAYYVYSEPALGYGTGDPASFFKVLPTGTTANQTPDVQFTVSRVNGQVRFDSSRPGGNSYEAALGTSFVLPYDHDQFLAHWGESGTMLNLFLARVPQLPTATQRIFVMSSAGQPRIQSGWAPNWNLPGLEVRFPSGKTLTVQGTLNASGAVLKATGSNWNGVRVESGGTSTFSNQATVRNAGFTVAGGTLTLNRAFVLNAPKTGVLAYGASSVATIDGDTEIKNSGWHGVQASNGADQVVIKGNSVVKDSGWSNIHAYGLYAVLTVHDATFDRGAGQALSATTGGKIILDDSHVARFNDYTRGALAETYATVTSGATGGDRLVQKQSPGLYDRDAFAQESADLDIDRIYWGSGITSSAQLSVWDGAGESVVVIDPVLTTDPGATAPLREAAPTPTHAHTASVSTHSQTPQGASVAQAGKSTPDERFSARLPFASQTGTGTTRGWVETIGKEAREGDADGAVDAVLEAFAAAQTDTERRMAWGGATRFAVWLGSRTAPSNPGAHARFTAFVSNALEDDEAAPWAHRALGVYALGRDRNAARDHIAALLVSPMLATDQPTHPGGRAKLSHADFGLLLRIHIAIDEHDQEDALVALASLSSDPVKEAARVLASVFPEADVLGTVARARQGDERTRLVTEVHAGAVAAFQIGPNPSTGRVSLYLDLVSASEIGVAVYDALGRHVATPAQGAFGAGASEISADLSALPAAVYVARLTVVGTEHTETVRFTITR